MKKFLSPQQFKLSKADLAPQKEISESPEDETDRATWRSSRYPSATILSDALQMNSVNQANDWRISLPLQNQSLVCRTFSLTKSQFSTRQLTQASQTPNNRTTSPSSAPRGKSEKRLCRQTATRASSPA